MAINRIDWDLSGPIGEPFPKAGQANDFSILPNAWAHLDPGVWDNESGEITYAAGGLRLIGLGVVGPASFGSWLAAEEDPTAFTNATLVSMGLTATYVSGEIWFDSSSDGVPFVNPYEIATGLSRDLVNPGASPGDEIEIEITILPTRNLRLKVGARTFTGPVNAFGAGNYVELSMQEPYGNPRWGAIGQSEILLTAAWITVAQLDGDPAGQRRAFSPARRR